MLLFRLFHFFLFLALVLAQAVSVPISELSASGEWISASLELTVSSYGVMTENGSFSIGFSGVAQYASNGTLLQSCNTASVPFSWSSVTASGSSAWFGVAQYCSLVVSLQALLTDSASLQLQVAAFLAVGVTNTAYSGSNVMALLQLRNNAQNVTYTQVPTVVPVPPGGVNSSSGVFTYDLDSLVWLLGQWSNTSSAPLLNAVTGQLQLPLALSAAVPSTVVFTAQGQGFTPKPAPYGHAQAAVILSAVCGAVLAVALLSAGVGGVLQQYGYRASGASDAESPSGHTRGDEEEAEEEEEEGGNSRPQGVEEGAGTKASQSPPPSGGTEMAVLK